MTEAAAVMTEARLSPWAPLRHPVFRALFIAQLASNIGTLMQSVGSAWLMGDLGASSFLIALVPTASMLPVLLVGIPGGALADIFEDNAQVESWRNEVFSLLEPLILLIMGGVVGFIVLSILLAVTSITDISF